MNFHNILNIEATIMKYLNFTFNDINNMLSPEFDIYYEKIIHDIKRKQHKQLNNSEQQFIRGHKL